jgi:hypothetical protein
MPGALREMRRFGPRSALIALLLVGLLLAASLPNFACAAEAALSVEVPAGQFKRARLTNLPKDAVLAVLVQTSGSGKLVVNLINERAFQNPSKPEEPIFMGSVERRLSFTVTIPETGNYFLVLDNRRGAETQKIRLGIRAERGRSAAPPPPQLQQPPPQLQPQPPRDPSSPAVPAPPQRQDKL